MALAVAAIVLLIPAPAQASLSDPQQVSPAGYRNAMVTTPQGETVIAWQEPVEDPDAIFGHREELWAAVKPADGPLGEPQLISTSIADCSIQLEVDAEGNVALSYSRWTGSDVSTVLRPPGGEFAAPLSVPEPPNNGGNGYQMDVAGGDVAVGFTHYEIASNQISSVYRATTSVDGGAYPEPTTLASSDPVDYHEHESGGFDLALAPSGELTMIWGRQDEYSEDIHGNFDGVWRLQTARLSPAGVPSAVQTLAESSAEKSCPRIDADASGRIAALWMEQSCNSASLNLAISPPGGQFADPVVIANSSWLEGPELDVAPDGTITVGYSDGSGVRTLIGSFDDPISGWSGASAAFADLASTSPGSAVIASRAGGAITVGNVTAAGAVEAGPWIATDAWYPVAAPLGDDDVAVLFHDYTGGLQFTSGSLEPTAQPDSPWVVQQPPPAASGTQLQLWDDGLPRQRLGRKLHRGLTCSLDCTVRAKATIVVRGKPRDRTFRLDPEGASGLAASPFDLRVPIEAEAFRAAKRALKRGRKVLAELRLTVSAAAGAPLRRDSVIELVVG